MNNMEIWSNVCTTPENVKRTIPAGRLKGFTDINPMWRFRRLTEIFGPAGQGWKAPVTDTQIVPGADGEVMIFVSVDLFYRTEQGWSDPVPGIGGSMLVEKEKSGLHNNDEGFKMAYTDAVGSACKAIGMSEDVYMSGSGGSKYGRTEAPEINTMEEAAAYVLTFGKYKGKTLGALFHDDRDYLKWLADNEKTDEIVKKGINILARAAVAAGAKW